MLDVHGNMGSFIDGGGRLLVQHGSFLCICRAVMADECWASWSSFISIYGDEGIGHNGKICS
jgi:hypothetical protein